jgi:hypothetical protein
VIGLGRLVPRWGGKFTSGETRVRIFSNRGGGAVCAISRSVGRTLSGRIDLGANEGIVAVLEESRRRAAEESRS